MKRCAGVFLAAASSCAIAQQAPYPSKPLRFVVGQAPSGATDIVARLIATKMTEVIGQNIVVENRSGAAGSIAAAAVAKSPPDGYTVLVASSSYSINASVYSHLPFDPERDLRPVSLLAEAPFLLVVHPSVPVKSVKELIALAKAKPGELAYGSGGNGSSGHMAGVLFESHARIKLTHVPYKGAGQALVDVLGGQLPFMFGSVLSITPHVKQGRLRVLAQTGVKRSSGIAELPTMAEAGVPGYATTTWYGLLVSAATPGAVVDTIAAGAKKAVLGSDIRERMRGDGADPVGSSPAEFEKHLAHEIAKWKKVVHEAGIASNS
ncbi:MAG TPA: tripartite tricarboxylate transporter substrate binding protein [Burkholderiales bacterium]|nr:tripartite tricarboxylate transporter substrate binding protein [Burkholderiales bacterium]